MKRLDLFKPGGILSGLFALIALLGIFSLGITAEVPNGSIRGTIVMPENEQPLPKADVILHRLTQDQFEGSEDWRAATDDQGQFSIPYLPAGLYQLSVYGKAHELQRKVQIREGKRTELSLEATRTEPALNLNAGSRVFSPNEKITILADGNTVGENLQLRAFAIDESRLRPDVPLSDLLYAVTTDRNRFDPSRLTNQNAVIDRDEPLTTKDIEGVFVQSFEVGSLPEGIYLLQARTREVTDYVWLTVTKIALVTKSDNQGPQAYVCDIDTGEPIAGADVKTIKDNGPSSTVQTGPDGLVKLDPPSGRARVMVGAVVGDSRAYTWFFTYPQGEQPIVSNFTFDRPIYRPGDEVQFKGTFREGSPNKYAVPAGKSVTIKVTNENGDSVQESTGTLNEFGAIDGSFAISEFAGPGGYSLEVALDGQTQYAWVPIASYRKPYFDIEVVPEHEQVIRGEPITFIVRCTAYTGEPIVGAQVSAQLMFAYRWDSPVFSEQSASEDDLTWTGDYDRQYEGTTDEKGEMRVVVQTRSASRNAEFADLQNIRYTLDASVSDPGGRYYSDSGSATAIRGDFDVMATWDRFVAAPQQQVELSIDVAPLKAGDVIPSELDVRIFREYYEEQHVSRVEVSKQLARISSGKATLHFTPDRAGSYVARVQGRDSRGNLVAAEQSLYVSGGATSSGNAGISIKLDKKDYEVGDTATAVIQAGDTGAVWVTVIGEKIERSQVVRVEGKDLVYRFPVTAELQPNFSICATTIRKHAFLEQQESATVNIRDHLLDVMVTADRDKVRPGESVGFTVETRDKDGHAVAADVALGVVDEGIYQIAEDRADPVDSFYAERWVYVDTAYSFPEIYLDGEDKGGRPVDVRQKFADTAFWGPRVRTDESGRATVQVKAPDNLTKWRATATAISASTQVGKGVGSVIASKELMLRFSLPSFLVQGDSQAVAITATNGSDQAYRATIELSVQGGTIEGARIEEVNLAPGESETIQRTIKVDKPGELSLEAIGRADAGFTDGVRQSIKVRPRSREDRTFRAGQVAATPFTAALELSPDAVAANLRIDVAPDLVGSLVPALDYLREYPYGCTEQTLSRFVPEALVRAQMRESNRTLAGEAEFKDVVRRSIERLRTLQRYDGTFGWFEYGDTDPTMTALAIDGLSRARDAGVQGVGEILDQAVAGAAQYLIDASAKDRRNNIELAAQVARFRRDQTLGHILGGSYKDMTPRERVACAIGFARLAGQGVPSAESEAHKRFAAIKRDLFGGGQTLSFGDERETASALEAVLEFEPGSSAADRLIQTLLQSRTGSGWSDTWRSSASIKAIVRYARTRHIGAASGTLEITLNGETIERAAVGSGQSPGVVNLGMDRLPKGKFELKFRLSGSGTAFVSARLDQSIYESVSQPVARPPEFKLTREYFRMQTVRLEDGSLRLRPSKTPSHSFKSGEVFRCRLTIRVPSEVNYVVIEDPIPSNTRIVDADKPEPGFEWQNWWANSSFFDNRAAFFAYVLKPGVDNVIEYAIRAEAEGMCNALPARAYPMYQPDVLSSTPQIELRVKR